MKLSGSCVSSKRNGRRNIRRPAGSGGEQLEHVIPFFAFPEEVRKIVYTTNAVESLNMSMRKVTKMRGSFPTEEAAIKLLYLALARAVAKWQTLQSWKEMVNYL